MRYLMNLINLKNISAVAVAVGVAVCLVPQSAEARLGRHSGSPNQGTTSVIFNVNTSVPDSNAASNEGLFKEAVQDATYRFRDPTTNEFIDEQTVFFKPADIMASEITETTYRGSNFLDNSFLGGIKYETTLQNGTFRDGSNSPLFVRFASFVRPQSSGSNINDIINSLPQTGIGGNTVAYDFDDNADNGVVSFPFGFKVEPVPNPVAVPEPNTTAGSILSIGVGALLLLKRKNRYKKLAQSRLTLSK